MRKIVTLGQIHRVMEESARDPRGRTPIKVTEDNYDGLQILINAIQPRSRIQPHMHPHDEVWIGNSGRVCVLTFDDQGNIVNRDYIGPNSALLVSIEGGVYHGGVALERSLVTHISKGPYNPENKIMAPWAPEENDGEKAGEYYDRLRRACLE